MTDKRIEPALTPEQWRGEGLADAVNGYVDLSTGIMDVVIGSPAETAALIAILNAALPDSDPRKLRWEHVRMLREEVSPDGIDRVVTDAEWTAMRRTQSAIDALADALESYLPAEER